MQEPRADFKVLQGVIDLSNFDFFLCHSEDVFDEENVRVVKWWDKLLGSIVMSPSVPAFKTQLYHHWNISFKFKFPLVIPPNCPFVLIMAFCLKHLNPEFNQRVSYFRAL